MTAAATVLAVTTVFVSPEQAGAATGTVTGTVFEDFNDNGYLDTVVSAYQAADTGVAGVVVTATDSTGAVVGTATTGASGTYSLAVTGSATSAVRIEFADPTGWTDGAKAPSATLPANTSAASGTSVQFVNVGGTANLGLVRANDYNPAISTLNPGGPVVPYVALAVQRSVLSNNAGVGVATANLATATAVRGYPYTSAGGYINATTGSFNTNGPNAPNTTQLATQGQVGSVWGNANYGTNQVFSSAFFKRFTALGPGGLGAIYTTNVATALAGTANATPWVAIPNAGTNPRPAGVDWPATPSTVGYDWFHDAAAYPQVGKIGLGDIDVNYAQTDLYAVNLNDRQLYDVPLSKPAIAGAAPVAGTPVAIALPLALPGAAQGCASADVRPFGLGEYGGKLYVTLTCTGPTTADLRGYVYTMDEATHAFSATPAIEVALNYNRGDVNHINGGPTGQPAEFQPWTDTFGTDAVAGTVSPPQPVLSNIVFDANGTASVSIKDRTADQNGDLSGSPNTADSGQYSVDSAGELLKFCGTPTTGWTEESNGTCGGATGNESGIGYGPGGGVFYDSNFMHGDTPGGANLASWHDAVMLGSALQLPGVPTIMTTSFDPYTPVYGGTGENSGFNQSGFRVLNDANGSFAWAGTLSTTVDNTNAQQTQGSFGKAGGLGDLSELVATAPQEIGNRVWNDTNKDGIQQAGEPSIPGVTVHLYAADGTTLLATAVTDANGEYYFSSAAGTSTASAIYGLTTLMPDTNYVVKVDKPSDYTTGGPLAGLSPTQTGAGTDRSVDSNGVNTGGVSVAAVTTGDVGQNDHSIDFGFTPPVYAVGDYVWYDANDNGKQDAGELPVQGVTVTLFNSDNTLATQADGTAIPLTKTNSAGHYVIDNLAIGTYYAVFSTLPAGTTFTTESAQNTNAANDSNPEVSNGQTPNFTITAVGGANANMRAVVAGDGTTKASAIEPTIDAGVIQPFDLMLTKTLISAGPFADGSPVSYSLVATNNGPGNALTGFTVTDKLPTGLSFAATAASGTNWTCAAPVGQLVTCTWTGADLTASASALPISVFATVDAAVADGTTLRNYAVVQPSPTQPNAETIPVGTTPDRFENGSNVPSVANPSNNDDSQAITLAAAPTYSVGNRLWFDTGTGAATNNGAYDSGELPVANAKVDLMSADGSTQLATMQTDANGYYRFDDLAAGTYVVRVDASNFATGGVLAGYESSTGADTAFAASDNDRDHGLDAATPGTTGVLSSPVTLGAGNPLGEVNPGATGNGGNGPDGDASDNLTVDFGFVQPFDLMITKSLTSAGPYAPGAAVSYSLVVRNNGPGIAVSGFTVTDKLPAGLSFAATAGSGTNWTCVTAAPLVTCTWSGADLIAGAPALPISVFASIDPAVAEGTSLRNYAVVQPSPDQRTAETIPVGTTPDRFENGSNVPSVANPSNNDDSQAITVSLTPTYALGNRVWFDTGTGAATNNGTVDSGELPVANAKVDLMSADGSTQLATMQTDANGYYRFDDLAAGTYVVRVDASNFAAGGVLAGYTSSTGADSAFAAADNNKDHGLDTSTPATTGVLSSPVMLSATNPLGDLDAGATGNGSHGPNVDAADNLTVDFGFVLTLTGGGGGSVPPVVVPPIAVPPLASTGVPIGILVEFAVAGLLLGFGLVLIGRRRRATG